MKTIVIVVLILFAFLQYKLWFANDGVAQLWHLKRQVETQTAKNNALHERNMSLDAEVRDLKNGKAAIEERARTELGMIKSNEVFYQISKSHNKLAQSQEP